MNKRKLGKSGIDVSEMGFGCWGIGGPTTSIPSYGKVDDATSKRVLARSFEEGITFYDTSNLYGAGKSESLLGEVFETKRDKVVYASKVGLTPDGKTLDFSTEAIQIALTQSLNRLRTNYLDLYQLHNPLTGNSADSDRIMDVLHSLKKEGRIRAIGVSVSSPLEGEYFLDRYDIDALQVNHNMIDQRAVQSGIFEKAMEKKVGIIARTPLSFGFLSGKMTDDVTFDVSDHRSRWPKEQIALWVRAPHLFKSVLEHNSRQTHTQMALRFCISHPAVSTVIPGMMSETEVFENVGASKLGPLSEKEIDDIRKIYSMNSFFSKGK